MSVMSIIDCGTLQRSTILHVTSVNSTGNKFGSTGTATCRAGYRLTNSSNNSDISQMVRCEETGMWTPLTGCEPKGLRFVLLYLFTTHSNVTFIVLSFQTRRSLLLTPNSNVLLFQ